MEFMNGYLIFALVATLGLISPGTTRYGVDVISGGVLASQFSVTVDGSIGRFTRSADTSSGTGASSQTGLYMQVERSAAFGDVYTALPGPALQAEAATPAAAGSTSQPAGVSPSAQLPPMAFSLAGMLEKLRSPAQTAEQRFTIEDPVAAMTSALSGGSGMKAADGATPAPAAQSGSDTAANPSATAASMTPPGTVAASGSAAQTQSSAPSGLSVSVFRRNNLIYLELADQGLVLVIHSGP